MMKRLTVVFVQVTLLWCYFILEITVERVLDENFQVLPTLPISIIMCNQFETNLHQNWSNIIRPKVTKLSPK